MDESAQASTGSVRVWAPGVSHIVWLVLVVAGPVGVVLGLWQGWWPLAAVSAVLPLVGARMIGWVEVGEHGFTDRRLMGESHTVAYDNVREVGIGMRQRRKTKLWYPEISTMDGKSVQFLSLTSASGQATIERVEKMYEACKSRLPEAEDYSPVDAVSVGEDGELEFAVAPGYETYLREKAKAEAEGLQPEVAPQQPAPVNKSVAEPAPRLTVAVESPPDIGEIDEEPEVFTPRPLTPVHKKPFLIAVSKTTVIQQPAAAPPTRIEQPKTVIEQPVDILAQAEPADGSNRSFTSLFRRAA